MATSTTHTTRARLQPVNLIGDLVERMTDAPPNCMFCGTGNVPDENGDIGPYLRTLLDRHWGDSCYICEPCAMTVGAIFGMVTTDDVADFNRKIRKLEKHAHNLEAQIEQLKRDKQAINHRLDAALTTKKTIKARKQSAVKQAARQTDPV